jgi:hypothetical protein
MKIIILFIFNFVFFTKIAAQNTYSDQIDLYYDSLVGFVVKDISKDYSYINSVPVYSHRKNEYKMVFSRETYYEFVLNNFNNNVEGITMMLLDHNKKIIMSNLKNNKFDKKINFFCTKTGYFYLKFTFKAKTKHSISSMAVAYKRILE